MITEKQKSVVKSAKDLEIFLNSRIYGRKEMVKSVILSLLNKENVLIQGKHGEGKSFITHLIADHTNLNCFYKQIHNQTTLQDILGVIDPIKFKNGMLDLIKTRFWTANFMFYDECLRNSDLLDFLLEVMVEHKCSKTILGEVNLNDLISVIATTNPTTEEYHTEKLDLAMLDRFGYIVNLNHLIEEDMESFKKVVRDINENQNNDVTKVEFDIETMKGMIEAIRQIPIPNEIYGLMDNFALNCYEAKIDYSTRMAQKLKKTLQTLAMYSGKESPDIEDFKSSVEMIFKNRIPRETYDKLTEKLFNVDEFAIVERITLLIGKYKQEGSLKKEEIRTFLKSYDKMSEKFLFFSQGTRDKIEEGFKIINSELMVHTHSSSLNDKIEFIKEFISFSDMEELKDWLKSLDLKIETRYLSSKENTEANNVAVKNGLRFVNTDTKNNLIKAEIEVSQLDDKNLKGFVNTLQELTKKNYLSRY